MKQFGRKPRRGAAHSAGRALEVENDSARKLEVVLRLLKEPDANVVDVEAKRDARVQAIVRSTAGLDGVGVAALSRDLGLYASAAKNSVQPGFPLFLPPGDLRAPTVGCDLHVFVGKNRGSKDGGNASFDSDPVVREVNHGGVGANATGIEARRLKAQPARPGPPPPGVVIAAAIEELRLR